jgi:hypothetical protein
MESQQSVEVKADAQRGRERRALTASLAPNPSPAPYLSRFHQLQQSIGNQAVGRLLESRRPQTSLKIAPAGDALEQEADHVADQVMRLPAPAHVPGSSVLSAPEASLQRKCASCEEEEEKNKLQRKESGDGPGIAPPIVHEALNSLGEPLDAATRAFVEPRFGHDFSRIRIHTDPLAAASARAINASAYTVGHNIVFGRDRYDPSSSSGLRLISHELTHVVQQGVTTSLNTIHRQTADSGVQSRPIDPSLLPEGSDAKWSGMIEYQYRLRGDTQRADAIRNCRTKGGEACTVILTATETMGLFALAHDSGGDEKKIRAGLPAIVPALAGPVAVSPRALASGPGPEASYLGLVGLFESAPVAETGAEAAFPLEAAVEIGASAAVIAAGVAAIVAISVICAIELWELSKFQNHLRERGFVIIDDPLQICVQGCHMPARPIAPTLGPLAPMVPRSHVSTGTPTPAELATIQSWLETPAAKQKSTQRGSAVPQVPPRSTVKVSAQPKSRKCTDEQVNELHSAVKDACDQVRGCTMQGDTCETATAKVAAAYACIDARERMQKMCFSPGDPGYQGHMLQIAQLYAALRTCLHVMQVKCT